MEEEIKLVLPWPPSMNSYWGQRTAANGQRIIVVTATGTRYQKLVRSLIAMRWRRPPLSEFVAVWIDAWAPSDQYGPNGRWFWDVDNRVKPTLDALAKSGVLKNDKLVRRLTIVDRGISPPGRLEISIRGWEGYENGSQEGNGREEDEENPDEAGADPAHQCRQGD